jgi:predicted alpha/beta-hydrolase family hydrolase
VLAHGAGAGMRHAFMHALAEQLAAHAIATTRGEFRYMTAGARRPPRAADAEAEVREVWQAHAARARLPVFAGGKSFGGRMTTRAHAAAPLAGVRGLVLVGFPLHPAGRPSIERAEHLPRAGGPLLFLQGTRDQLAELALLRPVIAGLGARATLHVIDRADHALSRAGAIAELAAAIAEWIEIRL